MGGMSFETYGKMSEWWTYPYLGVDHHGQVIDVMSLETRGFACCPACWTSTPGAGV